MTLKRICMLLILLPLWVGTAAMAETGSSEGDYVENERQTCLTCHNTPTVKGVLETPHFTSGDPASPGEQYGCQSCHGPARAHVNNPMQVKPWRFGQESGVAVEKQNSACLDCHESGERNDWHASTHAIAGVACTDCHSVHQPREAALSRQREAGICFDCHLDKRQALRRRSHHPIEEGLVGCTDCHNPHGGSGPAQLQAISINETCTSCHAEKRGPFLWEHSPVVDDCTNCHDPHGSVHPQLLVQRPPFLCQQCHSESFHPGTLRSGTGLPTATADNKVLDGACTNCHSQVHGSNHPSGIFLSR